MKKGNERSRPHWGILVTVWGLTIGAVFVFGSMQLGDRIQTASMITLVFITLFYAVQTQNLVKEETKHRAAEFGEKKINVLLGPLSSKMLNLRICLSVSLDIYKKTGNEQRLKGSLKEAQDILSDCRGFVLKYWYLTDSELGLGALNAIKTIDDALVNLIAAGDEQRDIYQQSIFVQIDSLRELIEGEMSTIRNHVQDTYAL